MNQFSRYTLPIIVSSLFFLGCSQKEVDLSSHKAIDQKAIDQISPKHITKREGYLQKSMDSFIEEEWSPTVSQDKNIQKKYMKKEESGKFTEDVYRNFTLQEYVDKAVAFSKAKPNNYEDSNVKRLENLPVIGK